MDVTVLFSEWMASYRRGISLFANMDEVGHQRADEAMRETGALEDRIAQTAGIGGAMAKLAMSVIIARSLTADGELERPWSYVIDALLNLGVAYPGVMEGLAEWATFDVTGSGGACGELSIEPANGSIPA